MHGTKMKTVFINVAFSLLVHQPYSAFQIVPNIIDHQTKTESMTFSQGDVYRAISCSRSSEVRFHVHTARFSSVTHFRRAFRSFGKRAVCNLSRAEPMKRKYPPIPLITTFEKNVLLPGETIHVDMPSPGTVTAISVAKAFVSSLSFIFFV